MLRRMTQRMNWDQINVFLTVAEAGSLLAASAVLGISPPTVARRLDRLEDILGLRLFDRRHDGYRLTDHAESLLPSAKAMRRAAEDLSQTAQTRNVLQGTRVRVASGFWFSKLITERLGDFHAAHPGIDIELVTGHAIADLDTGEADISIRNVRPEGGDLIMRKLGESSYAIYGSEHYVAQNPEALQEGRYSNCDWVGPAPNLAALASQVWLSQRLTKAPVLRCSQTLQFLDAVKSGVGLTILPQMIGNREAGLMRVSEPIQVGHDDIWLIVHENQRSAPAVRAVINWLVPLFKSLGAQVEPSGPSAKQ